jgi:type I restriction enzyme S subunit
VSAEAGNALPTGWATATLGDVLAVIRGVTYRKEDSTKSGAEGFVPVLRANGIQNNLVFDDLVYVPASDVTEEQFLRKGDIVVAASSGSASLVGKAAQLHHGWRGSFGAFCFGLRPEPRCEARLLGWFLHTKEYRNRVSKASAGVNINNLRAEHIETTPIRVPPASEQTRIADILDELLTDLDAGVAALERVQTKLVQYRAAVLKAAVEGALTADPPNFVETQLRTLINGLGQGWSPKCELKRDPLPDEWAIIKTTAVQSMRYSDCEAKPLPEGLTPRPHIEIRAGDMLMTRKGPRKRAGVTCLVRSTRHRLLVCDTVYRFRCNTDLVEPAYLELALNSPRVVAAIDGKKSGINDSGVSLTHQKLGEIRIPLPPHAEQAAIVEAVEDQLSVIEHLEGDLEAKLKSAQALRQSILRHAFSGQLVPQDPNDEPASELLKRIAAERDERAREARGAKQAKRGSHTSRRRDTNN